MIEPLMFILLVGVTLLLGYIGNHIFSKTKIPDVIWLFIFGILIAYFGFVPRAPFVSMSNLMISIALFVILFDAGLNTSMYKFVHDFSRSFLLALTGFVFSMLATAAVAVLFFRFDLLTGLLLGSIVGGTSSALVISMISHLKIDENTRTTLHLESILTDPIVIVVAMTLMALIVPSSFVATYSPVHGILSAFSIGAVAGVVAGLIWLFLLDKIRGKGFDYMVTLGVLFLLYAGVQYSDGSGAIAALFFGLVLGNGRTLHKILRFGSGHYEINEYLKKFQSEITFFIRSFFFVFLGLIVVINQSYIIYGVIIAVVLIAVRLLSTHVSMLRMEATSFDKNLIRVMAPRGLAAAIMAQLAIVYNVPGADVMTNIIFVVIFVTTIYSSVCVAILSRKSGAEEKECKEEKAKEKKVPRKKAGKK
ncbi:MAG: cation:proton antiporter [Candidatus Aenigmatarchaeota archaeon]